MKCEKCDTELKYFHFRNCRIKYCSTCEKVRFIHLFGPKEELPRTFHTQESTEKYDAVKNKGWKW